MEEMCQPVAVPLRKSLHKGSGAFCQAVQAWALPNKGV